MTAPAATSDPAVAELVVAVSQLMGRVGRDDVVFPLAAALLAASASPPSLDRCVAHLGVARQSMPGPLAGELSMVADLAALLAESD